MSARSLYCSSCRSNLGHYIAHGRFGPDAIRQVNVTAVVGHDAYSCVCGRCGHQWISRSREAKEMFERDRRMLPGNGDQPLVRDGCA